MTDAAAATPTADEHPTGAPDPEVPAGPDATSPDATSPGATSPDATSLDPTSPDESDAHEAPQGPVADEAARDAPGTATGAPEAAHATFVPVEVMTLAFELTETSPTVHLREAGPPFRGIIFPIGLPEAQSIARALEGDRPTRPATHDLLATVLAAAGCDLVAVRITSAKEGMLLAELDLMGPRGREVVDCRPTDGIALALRTPVRAPILCEISLLD